MALSLANITRIQNSAGGSVSGAIGNMSADNLMVTIMSAYGTAGSAAANHQVSDSEQTSSAYSTVISKDGLRTSSNCSMSLHYHANTVAGSGSSGNCSGGVNTSAVVGIFYEFAGASTAAPFTTGEASGSTGASSAPDSGSITNSVADSVILVGMTDQDGSNPALYTINQGATVGTYTENTSSGRQLNGASFPIMGTAYQIVAAGSSQRHIWQSTSGTGNIYATVIAAFGAPAGGGTARLTPRRSLLGIGF